MRRATLGLAVLLLASPTASASGQWIHAGPPAFPPMTAVTAQGNTLFALARDGGVWRSVAGA